MKRPLYQAIASALIARKNCENTGNAEWLDRWTARLKRYDGLLPSGAGIDNGSVLVKAESGDSVLVIRTSFHHMNESGMYDGWTEHQVTVRPSLLHGIVITVGGRNRNDIRDYLAETFDQALRAEVDEVGEEEAA